MTENRKLQEKTALLMRLFWLEILFKTGKQLKLPYFDQFSDYWAMNHYQAALEIARSIDDDQLLRLARENPSKYELSLGGFQGNYYSATERGLVSLESSWPKVKDNAKRALERWQLSAFGALQGVLRLGGETTYWKLLEEAETLGARVSPSLLKRLEALKLLFKTGSNRYPTWTIPTEIVPPLKEELEAFIKSKNQVENQVPSKAKGVILVQPRHPYTALREVERILGVAKEYLKIVDPWLGEESLDFLWKVSPTVPIRVLTKTVVDSESFNSAYRRLVREKGGGIEIRKTDSDELHDRIIITEDQVWLLGPSLKDLGKKLGTISKISDKKVRNQMETFFDRIWNLARQI